MNNRYFVVGYQRSGTTLIHLLLKDHPDVSALNDELQVSPFFSKGISCFTHGNDYRKEKELGYSRMFDTLTTLMADDRTMAAHGAKCVCNSDTNAKILVDVISRYIPDMKIIHVVRNDLVAQYASMLSSSKSGIMHSWYRGYEKHKTKNIHINRLLFIRYVLSCLDTYAVINKLKHTNPFYTSVYEEYLKNPDKAKSELFSFIGVPDLNPDWLTSKKVLPDPESFIHQYRKYYSLMEQIKDQYENNTLPASTIFMAKAFSRLYYQFNIARILRARKRSKIKNKLLKFKG